MKKALMCLYVFLVLVALVLPVHVFACLERVQIPYEEKTLQKGTFSYPVQPDLEEEYRIYCPEKVCQCEADVRYISFKEDKQNPFSLKSINDLLKASAKKRLCNDTISYTSTVPKVTSHSPGFISIFATGHITSTGGNGSCHGANEARTFNTKTGKELFLKDIVDISRLKEIRAALAKTVVGHAHKTLKDEYPFAEKSIADVEKIVADSLSQFVSDDELLKTGFYIEDGKVFVNTEQYYFSCAAGNIYPGELPVEFVKDKELLAELSFVQKAISHSKAKK